MTPETRKAIEEKAESAANADYAGIPKHALIRHVFTAGAEAMEKIMQAEIESWKAKYLGARMSGFSEGKEEMRAENQRLREALDRIFKYCAIDDFAFKEAAAALKDPGGV